jgi:transposase
MVRRDSALSGAQRAAAVALFAVGYGWRAVARMLGVGPSAVREVWQRWRIWGDGVLEAKPTKRTYAFEIKDAIVQRFLAGEPKRGLAQEYARSSPGLLKTWVKAYRTAGEEGLRPNPKGRPKRDLGTAERAETELDRLRRENERLRAEVAYLGKLRALSAREQRSRSTLSMRSRPSIASPSYSRSPGWPARPSFIIKRAATGPIPRRR